MCRTGRTNPPGNRGSNPITVCFTKFLYAQLSQQRFHPDQKTAWKLPSRSDPRYKAYTLGHKLTCGFEILCSRSSGKVSQTKEVHPSGPAWTAYLTSLNKNNYFEGELEGSRRYNELYRKAEKHFNETFSESEYVMDKGMEILQLIKEAEAHVDEIKQRNNCLLPEDDDSWLNLTPEDLDKMLLTNWGQDHPDQEGSKERARNLEDVVENMKSFVDKISDYEGVELDDGEELDDVRFDPDSFSNAMERILDNITNRNENDSLRSYSDNSDEDLDEEDDITCRVESEIKDPKIADAVKSMEDELSATSISESFEKGACQRQELNHKDTHSQNEDEGQSDVDIDINLVKNFLESFGSQEGLSGPVSNILQSLGMNLPPDDDR